MSQGIDSLAGLEAHPKYLKHPIQLNQGVNHQHEIFSI